MAQLLTGTRIYGTGTVDTQLFVSGTNSATSTTTGALQVVGGVGVGGNLYIGGTIYGAVLGTASTATNSDNIKTVLQTANASYYPAFVDSNNSTAAYEALYTTSSFVINPGTGLATHTFSTAGNTVELLRLSNPGAGANTQAQMTFYAASGLYGSITGGYGAAAPQMVFNLPSATTGNYIWQNNSVEQMRINTAGQVGIGTSSPQKTLQINATTATIRLEETGAGAKRLELSIDSSAVAIIGANQSASSIAFQTVGTERLRITANGGIAFGGATNYGVSGQILQSNGDAAPTWISTGSLAAANATTATHLSGGVAGQLHYQTAPGVTSFVSTGTAGNVLVSNGSSSPTYNSTLTLTGGTTSVSTQSGTLQVVGGFGLGGDAYIGGNIVQIGGTHSTLATTYNLINTTATTVNFAGAATTLTMGASGSGTTNVRNNLTVSGNLTVQGTTTIVDSTVTNIADPIITLGGGTGNSAPTADDNKDRGVAFKWVNNGGTTSTGFFGYDDSTGYFTYVQTATITNEVVSGTKGAMDVNLAGGTAMSIVYQSSQDNTAFLAATTSGYLLQTNGTGSAPSWVNASGVSAGSATYADNVRTIAQTASATYYPTFVDSNNASNAYELLYTTGTFAINPATGFVGIGTASPNYKLTIEGSVAATGTATLLNLRNTSDGGVGINFANSVATSLASINAIVTSSGAGTDDAILQFSTAVNGVNTERMRIDSSGNVGIGTTSSTAKLEIGGTNPSINFGPANVTSGAYLTYNTSGNYFAINAVTQGVAYRNIILANDGGGVGVGTTSPAFKLEVAVGTSGQQAVANFRSANATASYNAGLQIYATPSATATSRAVNVVWDADGADAAGVDYFYINKLGNSGQVDLYQASNAAMTFSTYTTERLRITAAGGIAFGGASNYGSSGFVLKSNGDAAPTWVDPSTLASASATNADNIRTISQAANASYYPTFVDSNNAANAYELVYTTSSFQINPFTGNIQIGMTSQDYQPSSGGTHTLRLNAANTSSIGFHDSGSTIGNIKFSGNYGFEIGAYDGLYGPHNTILHGTVGIGTQSPGAKLEVYVARTASTNAIALLLNDNVTGAQTDGVYKAIRSASNGGSSVSEIRFLETDGTNNNTGIAFATAATAGGLTERMRITPAGAIAFGGAANYGSSGQILQSNGNTTATWVALSSRTVGTSTQVNTVLQTANATYYPTFVDSNNASATAESLYTSGTFVINPGLGYVGIGQNNPQTLLHLSGTGQSIYLDNLGVTNQGLKLRYQTNSAHGANFTYQPNDATTYIESVYATVSGTVYGDIYFRQNVAGTQTTRMTIKADGGNVGIGTTSPNRKLHVQSSGAAIQLWDASTNGGAGIFFAGASTLKNWFIGNQYNISDVLEFTPSAAVGTTTIGTTPVMVIQSGGNVGIGTTNPPNKLTVSNGGAVGLEIQPTGGYTGLGGIDLLAYNRSSSVYAPIGFVTNASNNSMVILTSGNVGIATVAPSAKLHVSGNAIITGNAVIGATTTTNKFEVQGTAGQLFSVSDSFTGTIFAASDVSGIPSIEVLDTGLVKLAQYNGAVTIGTGTVSSSTAELSVYGMLYTSGAQGEIRASSEITAYFSSDARLKENIKLIENPITIIDQIRGVTFDWTDEHMARRGGEDGYFVRKHDIGVIAQEVQAVLPELVGTREDGYLAVKYEKMVPLLIEAIKSQQKTIDTLTSEIKEIKEFLSSLKNN